MDLMLWSKHGGQYDDKRMSGDTVQPVLNIHLSNNFDIYLDSASFDTICIDGRSDYK